MVKNSKCFPNLMFIFYHHPQLPENRNMDGTDIFASERFILLQLAEHLGQGAGLPFLEISRC